MDIENINKQIQQEKEHHARTINRLQKEICKQNERHRRIMFDLQNKKFQQNKTKQNETLLTILGIVYVFLATPYGSYTHTASFTLTAK